VGFPHVWLFVSATHRPSNIYISKKTHFSRDRPTNYEIWKDGPATFLWSSSWSGGAPDVTCWLAMIHHPHLQKKLPVLMLQNQSGGWKQIVGERKRYFFLTFKSWKHVLVETQNTSMNTKSPLIYWIGQNVLKKRKKNRSFSSEFPENCIYYYLKTADHAIDDRPTFTAPILSCWM